MSLLQGEIVLEEGPIAVVDLWVATARRHSPSPQPVAAARHQPLLDASFDWFGGAAVVLTDVAHDVDLSVVEP